VREERRSNSEGYFTRVEREEEGRAGILPTQKYRRQQMIRWDAGKRPLCKRAFRAGRDKKRGELPLGKDSRKKAKKTKKRFR